MTSRSACAALLCLAMSLNFALAATPAAPDKKPVASPLWRSTLEKYRPYSDEPVRPWRESNEEVARRGGWMAYARESAAARSAGTK